MGKKRGMNSYKVRYINYDEKDFDFDDLDEEDRPKIAA